MLWIVAVTDIESYLPVFSTPQLLWRLLLVFGPWHARVARGKVSVSSMVRQFSSAWQGFMSGLHSISWSLGA